MGLQRWSARPHRVCCCCCFITCGHGIAPNRARLCRLRCTLNLPSLFPFNAAASLFPTTQRLEGHVARGVWGGWWYPRNGWRPDSDSRAVVSFTTVTISSCPKQPSVTRTPVLTRPHATSRAGPVPQMFCPGGTFEQFLKTHEHDSRAKALADFTQSPEFDALDTLNRFTAATMTQESILNPDVVKAHLWRHSTDYPGFTALDQALLVQLSYQELLVLTVRTSAVFSSKSKQSTSHPRVDRRFFSCFNCTSHACCCTGSRIRNLFRRQADPNHGPVKVSRQGEPTNPFHPT